jgi:hypothetical protein
MSVYIIALCAGFTPRLLAQSYTLIDVPGATATVVTAINHGGDVAGYFSEATGTHAFVREFNGNIAVFDGIPVSINDARTTTGYFSDSAGRHNFVRDRKGNVAVFDVAQVYPTHAYGSTPAAINDRGEVAGYLYINDGDVSVGFLRDRLGAISTFYLPYGLVPSSINARGEVAGYSTVEIIQDGFVRDSKGNISVFGVPEAGTNYFGPRAHPVAINDSGVVAGYFADPPKDQFYLCFFENCRYRGFVRDNGGNITVFDATPNASSTLSACINAQGDIAGGFSDTTGAHGFVRDANGNIAVFDVPNATGAQTVAINDRGDVAGYFFDAGGTHGFVRSGH